MRRDGSQCKDEGRIDNTFPILKLGLALLVLECHSAGGVRRDAVAEITAGSNQDEGMHLCSHLQVTEQLLQLAISKFNSLCRPQYRPLQKKCIFLVVAHKAFSVLHGCLSNLFNFYSIILRMTKNTSN